MSDSWRRATAAPFNQRGGADTYLAPPLSSGDHRSMSPTHYDTAALEVDNARLRTRVDHLAHSQADYMREEQDRTRALESALQKERTMVAVLEKDNVELAHELHAALGENSALRHRVSDLESALTLERTRCENQVANSRLAEGQSVLRLQAENERLLKDIAAFRGDADGLGKTVADLRAELRSASATIQKQSETIAGLTTQMSRLDPVSLVKAHRERGDVINDASAELQRNLIDRLENLTQKNAQLLADRDALTNEIVALRKARDDDQLRSAQATDSAVATLTQKLTAAEAEKTQLRTQLLEARKEADSLRDAVSSSQSDKFTLQQMKAALQKAEAKVSQLEQAAAASNREHTEEIQAERKAYEAKIMQLRGRLSDAEADALAQEKNVADARKQAVEATRKAQEAEAAKAAAVAEAAKKAAAAAAAQPAPELTSTKSRGFDPSPASPAAAKPVIPVSNAASVAAAERQAAMAGDAPVEVTITVVDCRGLLNREGGRDDKDLSDPFVSVLDASGKELLRTPTVDNDLNPVFDKNSSTFRLPLSASTPGHFTFQVWDWNRLRNAFLGQAVVPIAELFEYGPCTRQFRLAPRPKESDSEVYDAADRLGFISIAVSGVPATSRKAPDAAATARALQQASATDVTIIVEECADILARDGSGPTATSDPYVVILDPRGETLLKTPYREGTLNPVFDKTTASTSVRVSPATPGTVTLQVWNWNRLRNDFLGEVQIPVEHLFAYGPGRRVLKLAPRAKENDSRVFEAANELGTITVTILGVPPVDAKAIPPPPPYHAEVLRGVGNTDRARVVHREIDVNFQVISASGLLDLQSGSMLGSTDPFVILIDPRGKKVLETKAAKKTLEPKWEPESSNGTVNISSATPGFFEFQVWDWNVARNNFLGRAVLSVKDLFAGGDGARALKLVPREDESDRDIISNAHKLGALTVAVSGVSGKINTLNAVVGAGPTAAEVAAAQAKPTDAPVVTTADVSVRVVGCFDLMDRSGTFTKLDPFVIVTDSFGKEVLRTPTVEGSLNPVFEKDKSMATIRLTSDLKGGVTVSVWNWGRISNSFLGQQIIPIKDIFAYGPGERVLRLTSRPGETDADVLKRDAGGDGLGTCSVVIGGVPVPSQAPPKLPLYVVDPKAPLPAAGKTAADATPATNVTVTVMSCKGLLERDGGGLSGKSDPFVLIKAGPAGGKEVLKTSVIDDCVDPVWPPESSKVVIPIRPSASNGVRLEVWNYNKVSKSDFLGQVVLTPQQIFESLGKGVHTLPLVARDPEDDEVVYENAHRLGSITFSLDGLSAVAPPPAPPLDPTAAAAKAAEEAAVVGQQFDVDIFIAACHDLLERDGGGLAGQSDPFVIVYDPRGKEIFRTPRVDDNCNPTWAKDIATAPIKLSTATPGEVTFEVWNWNRLKNDFLGFAALPVAEMFAVGSGKRVLRLQPRPKENDSVILENAAKLGTMTLFVSGLPVTKAAPQVAAPAAEKTTAATSGAAKPEAATAAAVPRSAAQEEAVTANVNVHVKAAKNLLDRDGNSFGSGASDPYVIIFDPTGRAAKKTPRVDDNINPSWQYESANATMLVTKGSKDKIAFEVWDWNRVKDTFLGYAELPAAKLFDLGNGTHTLPLGARQDETDNDIKKLVAEGKSLGALEVVLSGLPAKPTPPPAPVLAAPAPTAPTANTQPQQLQQLQQQQQVPAPQAATTTTTKTDQAPAPKPEPANAASSAAATAQPSQSNAPANGAAPAATAAPVANAAAPAAPVASAPTVAPAPQVPAAPPKPKEALVTIYVSKASNLLNRDGFGSGVSDPFLIFTDPNGKEILRTDRIDDNINPTWTVEQATAKLTIPYATATSKPDATVDIQVWDWNVLSNSFLGQRRLRVTDLFANSDAVVGEHTFDLEPRPNESEKVVAEAAKSKKLGTITLTVKVRVVNE